MTCRIAALACLSVFLAPPLAAEPPRNLVQAGPVRLMPQSRSGPLRTELAPSLAGSVLGVQERFVSPGTSSRADDADTLLLAYSRRFGVRWSLKLEGGIPARVDLRGEGVIAPTGPTGRLFKVDLGAPDHNPLASARQWSPTVILQYALAPHDAQLQPHVGVGASYTWFSDIRLDRDFEQSIRAEFGRLLALATGNPGPTSVHADASSSIAPLVTLGASYALTPRWSVSVTLSQLWLDSDARIEVRARDGTRLARSTAGLEVDPLVAAVLLGYRF